jgi:thiosulfate dehydrogenase
MRRLPRWMLPALLPVVAGFSLLLRVGAQEQEGTVVLLCDNETEIVIPGLRPGEKLERPLAQQLAELFMVEWRKKNPGSNWIMPQALAPGEQPVLLAQARPASQAARQQSSAAAAPAERQTSIYNRFTPRDEFVWKNELDKFVKEGDRIFHDAEAFGGTVGVSCDMCHPHASNTHPETYPKYQVQLQRVALLRDMINWCIQHPTKGKPLADDDPRMRAMEAYILAQRKGKAIEPGKH